MIPHFLIKVFPDQGQICKKEHLQAGVLFCVVFKFCNSVVKNENLTMDMHPKAVEQIMDYINIYSKYCNE